MVKFALNEVKAKEICDDISERIFRQAFNIDWQHSGYLSPKNEVIIQIFPQDQDIRMAVHRNPVYVLRSAIEEKFPDLENKQELHYHTNYLEYQCRSAIHIHACIWSAALRDLLLDMW